MGDADSKPPPQASGLSRWTPSIPTNIIDMLNPFSNDDSNTPNAEPHQSNKRQSIFASILPSATASSTANTTEPESPGKDDDGSLFFDEPEDARSNSDGGSETGTKRGERRTKAKTCYSICHPPPSSTARQRMHRRPRSLIQLHKLSSNARPQPAYEVIPSTNFSVRLTKAITKVFKTKHGLCPNDLVILRAEKYAKDQPTEDHEAKDIIALICKGRKEDGLVPGKAKICLPEGREWEAYPAVKGGYEFFSTDEHGLGLTVRWVPKRSKDAGKVDDGDKKRPSKFNFSTISPNSRRHPVIAALGKTGLEIYDTYRMPDPSAATPLSTPQQGPSFLSDAVEEEEGGKPQCETDDRLRQIVIMTGIFVAFKEGWSPYFKYDDKDKDKDMLGVQRSPSLQYSPARSQTFASPVSTPPASPGSAPLEKRNSFMGIIRTGSLLSKGNRNSSASFPEIPEATQSGTNKAGRKRADSASTVLVHRAASNRAKHRQATWRPDLVSEMHESSKENSPRSPSAPLVAAVAPWSTSASPTPDRRHSLAQPILPPTHASDDDTEGESEGEEEHDSGSKPIPRSVTAGPAEPEKRESSTTTATSSSDEAPRKVASPAPLPAPAKKKKSGLRRLLCGSGRDVYQYDCCCRCVVC